ncbi:hypothetical protein A2313_00510 [Candidatus Roizmanbacteria bacterium RIFOXYB2_FULL_41_10]|uniref:Uncharacterized protein n=1 Tax=Candidatus Roizmanbacteria bacterium RIFOXYA1_FULL_41_12 TaxID=1802082 RepID=A0A1F7KAJ7_9BACT|nr:MAG: hypothetical protein A2209_04210 [Candidatus Roizmanbacteria bacterium RIFOXYA1_FULL_41_12]OGK66863.1 MAG: hypothetical protein A2377_03115 [Candidatus Roizmanbacteria bacterium RIFOXYB1_FULL_41_27]OGK67268.1 MAG: hypothetical protein A2262_01815 [Candidatus Roizmanbacteria bacterium RIFOXYA2_FULL_41_8]OGK70763.1 MAG: hypothetical protein A2403_01590 [Candidatus Roizmanbacteria bacterium RIFOXYC1_FULL_41_16]OGK71445.1 MAG: hypothetical protein A2313_00510 [Candidatus Roizmanbacteria bac
MPIEFWSNRRLNKEQINATNYFDDRRPLRSTKPKDSYEQILERDVALSLLGEIRNADKRSRYAVIYWGIIIPEEIVYIVDPQQIRKYNPNCVDSTFTNLWVYSSNIHPDLNKPWEHLILLSPNHQYPHPYSKMLDLNG